MAGIGEWRVASGEWRVASGEWRVGRSEISALLAALVGGVMYGEHSVGRKTGARRDWRAGGPKGVSYQEGAKTAELSKIFDWYKRDFKEGGPIAFINKRRSSPLPNDVKISYQEYDWSLNEVR